MDHADRPQRQLTLFDSTNIIVGIIIGAGIFESAPLIASNLPSFGWVLAAWLLGGVVSLIGAACYAELATAFPHEGGDYVFLTRGLGRTTGFLFAWSQLWVIRPGSIGAMAYVFARYANRLCPLGEGPNELAALMTYAALAVAVLSGVNILGVRQGKWTQNVFTMAKVLGLAAIILVGLCFIRPQEVHQAAPPARHFDLARFGFAMILVLYAYGGWNEMPMVGAEVRNPRRNILRAMLLGTLAVTAIYVLVNAAFLHALGLEGMCRAQAVAAEMLAGALGPWASLAISLLICISALGAINGMIFTGGRIYYALGTEHRLYARLGRWSPRFGTPAVSLALQAAVTLVLIVGFGLLTRGTKGGFQSMIEFTTPIFWVFLLLVGVSLFVLRWREPHIPRPYRVPGYPLVPLVFCGSSLFMLYSSLSYAIHCGSHEPVWAVAIMLVGVAMSFFAPPSDRA